MNPDRIATFSNPEFGIVSTVTKVSKGYAVTLIDADAESIVGCRIFPLDRLSDAVNHAHKLSGLTT